MIVAKRVRFLRLVLVLALLALVVRLVDVQVLESAHYQSQASRQLAVPVIVPAVRGGLYSRDGQVLAMSVPTSDVYADDFLIVRPVAEAAALAPLLHVPATKLASELHQRSGYVPLAKQLSNQVGKKIAAAAFPGITVVADSRRVVPNGNLAAPVLGIVNGSGNGAAGLEYQYDTALAGKAGSETLLESPAGIALPQNPVRQTSTEPGTGLELTLDEALQYQTEQALAAEILSSHAVSGSAIVMDVKTGDILSMANLVASQGPGPRVPATSPIPIGAGDGVDQAPSNLALTQLFEPGSVFKLVTFSGALQAGVINPGTTFSVPGQITLDGSIFHDAESHPTEQLTASQILAQSSNLGTYQITQALGESRLLAQVKKLGFGVPTGLHFPGESAGILATPAQWEPTDLVSLPIGQVDAVNAQQVLDAYNAVANGGVFVQPRLVRGTVAPDGTATATRPSPSRRVISAATNAELTTMLQGVVAGGTGTSAVVPGYSVAGKTGTAQIPTPGKDSYVPNAFMATFVGFAPADHPVFSAIVVLNRPTPIYGGTVAAPVFSQIMSYALHRYDIPSSPGAPSSGGRIGTSQVQDVT
ncbi:MAG TPA: penicillin-binding protein 2 [Acidimicrobiales bacterium]|nr:penicillin-binding protein 2 [Acidimicrobiales bacterium]